MTLESSAQATAKTFEGASNPGDEQEGEIGRNSASFRPSAVQAGIQTGFPLSRE